MKANIRTLMAAVTLAAGLAAAPMALGQADLQRQQLEKQEQEIARTVWEDFMEKMSVQKPPNRRSKT